MYYNPPSHSGAGWDYHWKKSLTPSFQYYNIPSGTGNWNNFVNDGIYSTYGAANAPVSGKWIVGIVCRLNNSTAYPMQLAFSKDHMYIRGNDNGTMSSWVTVK